MNIEKITKVSPHSAKIDLSIAIVVFIVKYNYRVEVFSMIADAMDGCFSKEIQYKMPYYFGILEVLRAMNIVINLSDDEHRDNVSDDENFNELVSVIKRVFENMMDKTSIPVNNSEKNNGNNKEVLTMQEKIHMAEESYSKFEKPKDMKMYSVYLD